MPKSQQQVCLLGITRFVAPFVRPLEGSSGARGSPRLQLFCKPVPKGCICDHNFGSGLRAFPNIDKAFRDVRLTEGEDEEKSLKPVALRFDR